MLDSLRDRFPNWGHKPPTGPRPYRTAAAAAAAAARRSRGGAGCLDDVVDALLGEGAQPAGLVREQRRLEPRLPRLPAAGGGLREAPVASFARGVGYSVMTPVGYSVMTPVGYSVMTPVGLLSDDPCGLLSDDCGFCSVMNVGLLSDG